MRQMFLCDVRLRFVVLLLANGGLKGTLFPSMEGAPILLHHLFANLSKNACFLRAFTTPQDKRFERMRGLDAIVWKDNEKIFRNMRLHTIKVSLCGIFHPI